MSLTLGYQKVINRLGEYAAKVYTDSTDGAKVQVVAIHPSTTVVTSSVVAGAATQGASTSISTAATIAAANSSRKGGYIHFPVANTDSVYVSLNNPAASTDMEMLPGSNFYLTLGFGGPPITNAVYGVAKSGTQKFILVEG